MTDEMEAVLADYVSGRRSDVPKPVLIALGNTPRHQQLKKFATLRAKVAVGLSGPFLGMYEASMADLAKSILAPNP